MEMHERGRGWEEKLLRGKNSSKYLCDECEFCTEGTKLQ